jgi:hypothetical protein
VKTTEIDRIEGVLRKVVADLRRRPRLAAMALTSAELGTAPGTKIMSVELEPVEALRDLHAAVLMALAPFAQAGRSADAFFRLPGEPGVNPATVAYVQEFVPEHCGERYSPHMTVGVGRSESIAALVSRPFARFDVTPEAAALYQLGDLGTARREIRTWSLRDSEQEPQAER